MGAVITTSPLYYTVRVHAQCRSPSFTPAKSTKIATIAERRKGPKLTNKVENMSVEFLVDTGAKSTALSRHCFETLQRSIKAKFQDNTSSVYVANGTKV